MVESKQSKRKQPTSAEPAAKKQRADSDSYHEPTAAAAVSSIRADLPASRGLQLQSLWRIPTAAAS